MAWLRHSFLSGMADKGVGIERPNMGVAAGKSSVLHPLFPLFKYLTPSLNKKKSRRCWKKKFPSSTQTPYTFAQQKKLGRRRLARWVLNSTHKTDLKLIVAIDLVCSTKISCDTTSVNSTLTTQCNKQHCSHSYSCSYQHN